MTLTDEELFSLFVNRKDVYAVKTRNGMYIPVHKEFTLEKIRNHLAGKRCYGVYQLDTDNTVKWCCVDIDTKNGLTRVNVPALARELKCHMDARIFIEETSRGFHVWACYGRKIAAAQARECVVTVVKNSPFRFCEVFPKQTELNGRRKYGNLVNFPMATHPVTGWRNTMMEV